MRSTIREFALIVLSSSNEKTSTRGKRSALCARIHCEWIRFSLDSNVFNRVHSSLAFRAFATYRSGEEEHMRSAQSICIMGLESKLLNITGYGPAFKSPPRLI